VFDTNVSGCNGSGEIRDYSVAGRNQRTGQPAVRRCTGCDACRTASR
jgi:hypothetical protein